MWPLVVDQLLRRVDALGISFAQKSAASLVVALEREIAAQRAVVSQITKALRRERHQRWRDSTAVLWRDRPGVVFHWLQAAGSPWGATPILDAVGRQCLSLMEVDAAVRGFWVDGVMRQHASVDVVARWAQFRGLSSPASSPR